MTRKSEFGGGKANHQEANRATEVRKGLVSQKASSQRRYSLTERADDRTGRGTEKKRLRKRRSFNEQGRKQDWSERGGESGALTFQRGNREGTAV